MDFARLRLSQPSLVKFKLGLSLAINYARFVKRGGYGGWEYGDNVEEEN